VPGRELRPERRVGHRSECSVPRCAPIRSQLGQIERMHLRLQRELSLHRLCGLRADDPACFRSTFSVSSRALKSITIRISTRIPMSTATRRKLIGQRLTVRISYPLSRWLARSATSGTMWRFIRPQSVVTFACGTPPRKGLISHEGPANQRRLQTWPRRRREEGRGRLRPQLSADAEAGCACHAGTLKTAEKIRAQAEIQRAALNSELKGLSEQISGLTLAFPVKAGETGKLYGSITTQDVASAIQEQTRYEVKRQQLDMQPIRNIGEYKARVRLTVDLIPEVRILVHREGESAEAAAQAAAEAAAWLSLKQRPRPRRNRTRKGPQEAAEGEPAAEAPAEAEASTKEE